MHPMSQLGEKGRVVALFSGGLDSTAMLFHLRDEGFEVLPLSIWYGQRHDRELKAVDDVCRESGCFESQVMNLRNLQLILSGSSQTDPNIEVPEGHYSADNMAVTVVPNRNMLLLSVAVAYAISEGAQYVAYAAHKGDHDQYPDCRQEFIDAMSAAIKLCDYKPPQLIAPFSHLTKAEIVGEGVTHHAPMELTWSCYKGGMIHCGRCGTCVERAEAFHLAGVHDPTVYEDTEFWKEACRSKES